MIFVLLSFLKLSLSSFFFYFSLQLVKKYKSSTSTFSLRNHLSNSHGIEDKEGDQNKLTQYFGKSIQKKDAPIKDKHYLLARRLVLLCARSLISFNCVTSEGFSDFMKSYGITVGFEVANRTTLTRSALDDIYRDVFPVIKNVIKLNKYSSLTFDIWTDGYRRKSYITFNYCCIDDDFNLQNMNLCTLNMPYRHRSQDVLKELDKTVSLFGIDMRDVYCVTDKGSNLLKLIKDKNLQNHFCLGHGFHNLINEDGFASVPEIDCLLTKIKKIVRALRFRSNEVEEEVNNFFFILKKEFVFPYSYFSKRNFNIVDEIMYLYV